VLLNYIAMETGKMPKFLGISVSSRKNLCIHPEVRLIFCSVGIHILNHFARLVKITKRLMRIACHLLHHL